MTCEAPLLSYAPHIRASPVAKLLLNFDWSSTPLGPIEQWPQSLKTVVSLMLANPSQSSLFWGREDKILLYNDAWANISGSKHPHLMGKPGRIAFHEIWDDFSVHCDAVYQGKHIGREDDLLFFDSKPSEIIAPNLTSQREDDIPSKLETYFTWSYLPVQVEDGQVGGIWNNCVETTGKVLSERRMATVRSLGERTASTRTTSEFWEAVADSLTLNALDFPFFLCYSASNSVGEDSSDAAETMSNASYSDLRSEYSASGSSISSVHHRRLDLVKHCGVEPGHPAAPSSVELNPLDMSNKNSWPFTEACLHRKALRAKNPYPIGFSERGWCDKPGDAILIPIYGPDDSLVGLVLFGLNTRRPYDEHYANFHQTLMRNLNAAFVAAQAFEREIQRTEELQALDRAKTVFFQNVSHELRTPLTLIRGPCEDALKEENKLDATLRSRFKLIFRASNRLLRLVNSLMLFSSAEARRLQAFYRPVRLGPVTSDLASLFRSAIEKAGITYNVECGEADDDREVYVDLSMWEKIVFNLLSNAVKYTTTGFIKLYLRFHISGVELRVEDSGCGIPQDQKELVLQRFHRVESTEGRSHEGTGIGLALTSELVKLHGGTIHVESALGKGSSFIVRIPRGYTHLPAKDVNHYPDLELLRSLTIAENHEYDGGTRSKEGAAGYGDYAKQIVEEANGWLGTDDSETASNLSVTSGPDGSSFMCSLTILLAEDNADARAYIKSILSTVAQVVVAVSDGRDALDYVRNHARPDLIVTDIMMPGLSGIELIQELANDADPIPVIVLTARSGSEADYVPEIESIGPIDCIFKPFSSVELLRRVQTRLDSISQKLELERQVQLHTAELELAQQRYRRMTELAPVAIFETDEMDRGLITFANERFFTLTGLPRSLPLRFVEIIDLMEPEYQSIAELAWADVLEFNKSAHFEFQFLNGRHALAEVVSLSSGSILGSLTDQTEKNHLVASQLEVERQKTDEAVHRRRLQEAFVDIVSHELRNPISAILQSADILSSSTLHLSEIIRDLFTFYSTKRPDPEKIQTLFEESQTELADISHAVTSVELCARHQTIIASDILVVSRLDSNLLSVKPVMFHLIDELQSTLVMFSVQAETQSIKFIIDPVNVTSETRIIADPTRLCQILVNLISNSCRALESWSGQRHITVQVSLAQSRPFEDSGYGHERQPSDSSLKTSRVWVSFRISDTGPGIPVEDQARLFTRFNDISSSKKSLPARNISTLGGTGLGLYLCRKLAELQGGAIQFSAHSGQGAAFFFFIEARIAENAPSIATPYSLRTFERFTKSGSISPDPRPTAPDEDGLLKHKTASDLSSDEKGKLDTDYFSIGNHVSSREPRKDRKLHVNNQAKRTKLLVLIVEDNAINQKLLKRQIEKAGFLAHGTDNGLEALQYLESAYHNKHGNTAVYPSLVLMDLEMPILDGLQATARIRTWEEEGKLPAPKLPIFAVTGNARSGQIDAARAAGMNDVYIKPYNIREIIRRIDLEGVPRHS
ncbi:hypothetical protein D9757_000261 [Collybiopsis confluens]|uniref:histidine kinase n=1 Tax=Collybiopsis confluens TaxID=2823264 RepID=A0A8H5MGN4_9AGAR|nr:hypothetical protein D9757_000261 [Collybiopsis confluens]